MRKAAARIGLASMMFFALASAAAAQELGPCPPARAMTQEETRLSIRLEDKLDEMAPDAEAALAQLDELSRRTGGTCSRDYEGFLRQKSSYRIAQLRMEEGVDLLLQSHALAVRLWPDQPSFGLSQLEQAAQYYAFTGRTRQARDLLRRAQAQAERVRGPKSWSALNVQSAIAELAELEGRFAEAETIWRARLAVASDLARDPKQLAPSLRGLATNLSLQGRTEEALEYAGRAIDLTSRNVGFMEFDDLAHSVMAQVSILRAAGRFAEAEAQLGAIESFEKGLTVRPLKDFAPQLLEERAYLYASRRDYPRLLQAATQWISSTPVDPAKPLDTIQRDVRGFLLAQAHYGLGDYVSARAEMGRVRGALARLGIGGTLSSALGVQLSQLEARIAIALDDAPQALEASDRALRAAQSVWRGANPGRVDGLSDSALGFAAATPLRLSALKLAAQRRAMAPRAAVEAAFLAAQATPNNAARALAASGALDAAGPDGAAFREYNALTRELEGADRQLAELSARKAAAIADRDGARRRSPIRDWDEMMRMDPEVVAAQARVLGADDEERFWRVRHADISRRVSNAEAVLRARAPRLAELAYPAPIPLARAQSALKPDEVLVIVLPGDPDLPVGRRQGFVLAITSEDATWAHHTLAPEATRTELDALRRSVATPETRFDVSRAHAIYAALFGDPDIARVLATRQTWLIAPQGAFLSLPFAALPMAPEPEGRVSDDARLRATSWLGLERTLAVLPSVASLQTARNRTAGSSTRPFFGVGDPAFDGASAPPQVAASPRSVFRGARVDPDAVRRLPRLPGTRREIEALGRILGAGPNDILLGPRASEAGLRAQSANLASARIVAFATHGLIGGELSASIAEPALALTPPERTGAVASETTSSNDGLLTASEVAQMRLNADLVVLSACNTAAAGESVEGLSGLARAFLAAGAQSLIVSQWSVFDTVAERLIQKTIVGRESGASAAAALRGAMRETMTDPVAGGAHPAVWAPFMIVGAP
ncbi:MAG: CHAT domain-containing tetratricopeptide repeat protein [Hyphomonadaceae bacterium]|nr:CHAT domain-containing tetratricopeptide repeat protein [Hyphomonadaceae bacterium]